MIRNRGVVAEKGKSMLKTLLSSLLVSLFLLVPAARTANAKSGKQDKTPSIDQIKVQVAKLGIGEKARGTITLKNGTKVKGYIYRAGDDDFVIRDRKTDAPTTIRYIDVAKVSRDQGHSLAKHLGLGIGIGAGAFLAILLIIFASLDD
jgi:hypothetical protein